MHIGWVVIFLVVCYSLGRCVFFNVGGWVRIFEYAELVLAGKLLWWYYRSGFIVGVRSLRFLWFLGADYLPWVVGFEGFPFIGTCSAIFF